MEVKAKCGRIALIIVCLCQSYHGLSQTDSTYIMRYNKHLTLKGFLYDNFISLNVKEANQSKGTEYESNNTNGIGIGLVHPKLPFEITLGYNYSRKKNNDYLRTRAFDLQFHNYGRSYVVDLYFQQYKGLYIDDPELSFKEANRPDLSILTSAIVGQYILNSNKFSYEAAYNQNERQIKSAGSILIGGGLYYFKIRSDNTSALGNLPNVESYQLGLNAGYSYNWAISKRWLFNASFSLGANMVNKDVRRFFDKNMQVNPTALFRSSCFYSKNNWHVGLSIVGNMVKAMLNKDTEINLGFGRTYIKVVRRFGK